MKISNRLRSILIAMSIISILFLVFLSYMQGSFVMDLLNRYILC